MRRIFLLTILLSTPSAAEDFDQLMCDRNPAFCINEAKPRTHERELLDEYDRKAKPGLKDNRIIMRPKGRPPHVCYDSPDGEHKICEDYNEQRYN